MNGFTNIVKSPSRKLSRKWRACVGAGDAAALLRADGQNHLRIAERNCAFERARLSGWEKLDSSGARELDAICDFLADIGVAPVARLNPTDNAGSGLDSFARHVIARYGAKRAHAWRFELPYGPKFSKHARHIKRMDPDLSVGAIIAASPPRRIMPERGLVNDLTITNTSASRPDFISISGSAENASRLQREIRETLQADPASNALKSPIPLHWDSVCEPHSAEEGLRDAITLTRQYLADDVLGESLDSMALASFSDCGTGAYLVDTWGVQQPSSHAYRMMDALGDEMIAAGSNWILTRDMLGRMIALAWYDPDAPANLTIDCMRPYSRVMIETIDRSHGWAYNTWRQMGMPESLTRCQVQALRQAALNTCVAWSRTNEEGSFTLTLPSLESLILVKEQ